MFGDASFAAELLDGVVAARWAAIAVGWLLTYAVHSTIILSAAWLIASRRRVGEPAREIIWKAALVGGLVTATLQATVAPNPLGGQLRLGATSGGRQQTLRVEIAEVRGAGAPRRMVVRRRDGTGWTPIIAVIWLAGAGAALLSLTFGHARVMKLLGDRTPLDATPLGERLQSLLARSAIDRRVALTSSGAIATPVALAGAEICMPRRALVELDGAEQESMLAHELAHIVRRDPYWLVAARVIESVFFFQPLNRLARRRMQEAAEYLCDDWAVQRTARPVMLAKCLAAVAEWVSAGTIGPRLRPVSAMVESDGSPLMRRVGRILGEGSHRSARAPRGVLVATMSALVLFTGAAPRVSVPNVVLPTGRLAFVQRMEGLDITATRRAPGDTLIVVRRLSDRAAEGSAVGPMMDGVARTERIIVRRRPAALPVAPTPSETGGATLDPR